GKIMLFEINPAFGRIPNCFAPSNSCSLNKFEGTKISVVDINSEMIVAYMVSVLPVPVGRTIVAGESDIVQCARIADNAPNCGIRKPSSPSSRETFSVYEVLQLLIISDLLNDFPSESDHKLNLFPRPIVEMVFLYFTVILLV